MGKYRSAPAVVYISGNLLAFKLHNKMSSNAVCIEHAPFSSCIYPDVFLCRTFTYMGGPRAAAQ